MNIEVAFAEPDYQRVIALDVPPGTTLAKAIGLAQIREDYPEVEIDMDRVGVWNRTRPADYVLHEGDRIEIYRRLIADPKQVRRERAAQSRGGS